MRLVRPSWQAFTLLEVMLAVAIFAVAAVGFAVALNDVLGIQAQLMRTSQVRQAVESCAARILAVTNNLAPTGEGFVPDPVCSSDRYQVEISANPVLPPVVLPSPDGRGTRPFSGWWQIRVRALDADKRWTDGVSFLLWPR